MTDTSCDNDRIRKGNRTLIELWPDPLSINEAHALVLGAALGLLIGERGMALKTILSEPQYFLGAFAALYALARHLYR